MGLIKKLASSAGKKAAGIVAKKAVKVLSEEKNIEKVTEFVNKTHEEFSNEEVARNFEKMKSVDVSKIVSETKEIYEAQKVLAKLQNGEKITQDILDAIVCDNKEKLAIACREAIRAEVSGKPLQYLFEEEVKTALSLRKAITKSVAHKVTTKIS